MRLGAAAATLQLLLLHAATAQMGTPCESFDLSYVTNPAITFSWVANDGTTGSANTTGVSSVSTGWYQIFPTGSLRIGNVGRNYATGTVFDMVSLRILTPCALQPAPPRTHPDGTDTWQRRVSYPIGPHAMTDREGPLSGDVLGRSLAHLLYWADVAALRGSHQQRLFCGGDCDYNGDLPDRGHLG